MRFLRDTMTIVHLTLHEALRRRILLATLVCGFAFLVLFAIALHYIARDVASQGVSMLQGRVVINFFTLAGLYAVNFLTVMAAVLLPIDTLAGDIASGVIQTVASKPVARSSIVMGKWLAYWLVTAGYLVLLAGGVVTVSRLVAHFSLPGLAVGLPLMLLKATVLVSLSIAGGTRFSTVTNGVVGFGRFGLAFLGGWVEQVAVFTRNDAARYVGTVASLIMPSESMWTLAAAHMQPPLMREMSLTPFSPASVPSAAMVWWTAGYVVMLLVLALRGLQKRAL
jgi:hypothetical protein